MTHGQSVSLWRGRVLVMFVGLFLVMGCWVQGGCSCGGTSQPDGGASEVRPENTGPFPTKIRFLSPTPGSIISGQITIEVEVIDGDGIDEVSFIINGKPYKRTHATTPKSTPESPRYAVDVATGFLPRGVLNFTVSTVDKRGDKAQKTIQVTTRERWVAAFGVGQVRQLLVRPDKHMYLRIYRTEQDISRVINPGPYDQVGSALVTASAVGAASWLYLGLEEEFSPFVMGPKYNIYFGSRKSADGTNRLLKIGPGKPSWTPEVPIGPEWETKLKEWAVKSKPLLQDDRLTVHLEKPAQGGSPAVSVLAQFNTADGKERWRYAGATPFEVLRGPYQLANGQVLFFSRKAGAQKGLQIQLVGQDGKQVWAKDYPDFRLDGQVVDAKRGRVYIGVEQRSGTEVTAASVICIDPAGQKECWTADFGKNWPDKMSLGGKQLFVTRQLSDGGQELVALELASGKEVWKKPFARHQISGIHATQDDACLVFAALLDEYKDPINLQIDRYDAQGNINWRYENKQYFPLFWLLSSEAAPTLWVVVRNIEDSREQLGHKLIALDSKGKRMFLFFEEARKHQFMQFFAPDVLYLTSTDSRDARVHNLIAK